MAAVKSARLGRVPWSESSADDWAHDVVSALLDSGCAELIKGFAAAGDFRSAAELADRLAADGRIDEAISVLEPPASAGSWRAVEKRARFLVEAGQPEEAVAHLRSHPESEMRPVVLVRALAAANAVAEAIEILGAYGPDLDARLLVEVSDGQDMDDLVESLIRSAIAQQCPPTWHDLPPSDAFLLDALARVLERQGRTDEAIDVLTSAHERDVAANKVSGDVVSSLMGLLARNDMLDRVRDLVAAGEDADAAVRVLADNGRFDEAIEILRPQVLARSAWAPVTMIELLTRAGRHHQACDLAVAELQYLLHNEVLPVLRDTFVAADRAEEALTIVDSLIADGPDQTMWDEITSERPFLLMACGRAEEALAACKWALDVRCLMDDFVKAGLAGKALARLRREVQDPSGALRARELIHSGRPDDALDLLRERTSVATPPTYTLLDGMP